MLFLFIISSLFLPHSVYCLGNQGKFLVVHSYGIQLFRVKVLIPSSILNCYFIVWLTQNSIRDTTYTKWLPLCSETLPEDESGRSFWSVSFTRLQGVNAGHHSMNIWHVLAYSNTLPHVTCPFLVLPDQNLAYIWRTSLGNFVSGRIVSGSVYVFNGSVVTAQAIC
jgi:hypothetical protein